MNGGNGFLLDTNVLSEARKPRPNPQVVSRLRMLDSSRSFISVLVGSVNSGREDFTQGLADLARFEELWPGLSARLITRRLAGLVAYKGIAGHGRGGIKTVIEIG